jgi:glycosyltransferase involved in cell wall biosynthesis
MRIVQIIDTLTIGGAEKMAVNYANSLAKRIEFSGIIATREEGVLKKQLTDKVGYLFLRKKRVLDFAAFWRLRKYCKVNKIDYVHAHGSSYFSAFFLKLIYPKIQLIWHNHHGLSESLSGKKLYVLKMASYFFKGNIAVNKNLENWAKNNLNCKNVIYLPNFTNVDIRSDENTILHGNEGKRILCLANLRFQKNHFLLLEIAEKLKVSHPDWSFHLVGNDLNDEYSKRIKTIIKDKDLNNIFIYGTKNDTTNIIKQSEITILTSDIEGLPVAIIEYGLLSKATVATAVGEIPLLIKNDENGFVVPAKDSNRFFEVLIKIIDDEDLRKKIGENLHKTISETNSEISVLDNYLAWLEENSNEQ